MTCVKTGAYVRLRGGYDCWMTCDAYMSGTTLILRTAAATYDLPLRTDCHYEVDGYDYWFDRGIGIGTMIVPRGSYTDHGYDGKPSRDVLAAEEEERS